MKPQGFRDGCIIGLINTGFWKLFHILWLTETLLPLMLLIYAIFLYGYHVLRDNGKSVTSSRIERRHPNGMRTQKFERVNQKLYTSQKSSRLR